MLSIAGLRRHLEPIIALGDRAIGRRNAGITTATIATGGIIPKYQRIEQRQRGKPGGSAEKRALEQRQKGKPGGGGEKRTLEQRQKGKSGGGAE
jgi:hypothetical protein